LALIVILAALLLIAMIIYPWLSIAVLLVAPVLKVAAVYYLPMFRTADPTLVVCILAGIMALWTYARRALANPVLNVPWRQLLCMLVIAAILCVSLLWTTAPEYGARKAFRFVGIGIPYLLLPMFFVRSRRDAHRMLWMIILVGVLVSVSMMVMPRSQLTTLRYGHGYTRGTLVGSDAVMPAVIMGLGMLVLATMFVVPGSATRWLRYSALIVFPLGLLGMLLTGARSTLVGLGLAATILPFLSGKSGRFKAVFVVFVLLPLGVLLMLTSAAISEMLPMGRWTRLFGSGTIESLQSRVPHFMFCLENFWSAPLIGHGSGSFAVDLFYVDTPMWPHNILLEALYETGLVGFIAMSLFLYFLFRDGLRALRRAATPADRLLMLATTVAVVFMLVQALTHWDLDGARNLYLFSGLYCACAWQVQNEAPEGYDYQLGRQAGRYLSAGNSACVDYRPL
jgi:O-antigen ligase